MFGLIRIFFKLLSIFLALFLVLGAVFIFLCMYLNSAPKGDVRPVQEDESLRLEKDGSLFLLVRDGESSVSVGLRLEQAGVIRNRYFWQFLSRFKKEYIKSGAYRIELPADQFTIHSLLVLGDQILVKVTLPEGITLKKTARILEEAGICGAQDFLEAAFSPELIKYYRIPGPSFEGYLYPDTYFFPLAFPAEKVVSAMADTFFQRIEEINEQAISLSPEALNEKVIIASIVEREYRVAEEAALMSGVFYNRLNIGMALQSCATVEYIITEIQGKPHPEVLYSRDIEIRDPYNTYIRPGLPPGPISAPGRIALQAAFAPASSNFLYFRLTDAEAGKHYFSRTLDDHIRAGALYVKGRTR
jgi:UPF0755 protein